MQRVRSKKQPPKPEPKPLVKADHQQGLRSHIRDRRFAFEFVKTNNATKAALAVGCPAKTARSQGSQLLARVNVQAIVKAAQERLEAKTEVTVERLLKELGKVAFASMQDFYGVDDEGQPFLDMSQLTPDQWAAIGEITTETFWDGPKDHQREVKRVKFKLHDKLGAIDKAMRHLGGYNRDKSGNPDNPDHATTVYTLNIGNANILVKPHTNEPLPQP